MYMCVCVCVCDEGVIRAGTEGEQGGRASCDRDCLSDSLSRRHSLSSQQALVTPECVPHGTGRLCHSDTDGRTQRGMSQSVGNCSGQLRAEVEAGAWHWALRLLSYVSKV